MSMVNDTPKNKTPAKIRPSSSVTPLNKNFIKANLSTINVALQAEKHYQSSTALDYSKLNAS
jgi:hypothetical protein